MTGFLEFFNCDKLFEGGLKPTLLGFVFGGETEAYLGAETLYSLTTSSEELVTWLELESRLLSLCEDDFGVPRDSFGEREEEPEPESGF